MSETETTSPEAPDLRRPLGDAELLARAARLVARGWCRSALAEDRDGRRVEPWSASACAWSPLGALLRVWLESDEPARDVLETAYTALALATGGRAEEWSAAPWRTQWHIVRAFARARENLSEARRRVRAPGPV